MVLLERVEQDGEQDCQEQDERVRHRVVFGHSNSNFSKNTTSSDIDCIIIALVLMFVNAVIWRHAYV